MERPESFAGRGYDEDAEPSTFQDATDTDTNDASRATAERPSGWLRICSVLAWAVALSLAAFAALRFSYHDGRHPLIWINAFTRYVYLPAYACLIFAFWKQRRWLAITNLAIVGCHLFWIAPDFIRDRSADATTASIVADHASTAKLRIFFANVRVQNPEIDAYLSEIASNDPDIVILVEYSLPWRQAFRQSSIVAKYRYGNALDAWQMDDVAVLSKLPLQHEVLHQFADRIVRSMDVSVGGQTLRLVGLHGPRPMNFHINDYDGFWKGALPLITSEHHPLVVIGDCNATQYSRVYEELEASGLRSAHEDRGRGYATTWPNGTLPLPPIRIDQAFLSPEVACLYIAEGVGSGSDHKPLILDVQVGAPQ